MFKRFVAITLALAHVANAGPAQSPFNGTWRPDPQRPGPDQKLDHFELADGMYDCLSCTPPYRVKANGLDQSIAGNPRYDTVNIQIVDALSVLKVAKKEGKIVARTRVAVSADGSTLTETQTLTGMLPRPVEVSSTSSRISDGPPGSHRLSGEWWLTEFDLANHDEDTTYSISGNTLTMSDRLGRSFKATLDGRDAAYSGDPKFTSVSVRLIGATLEETDKKDGKVVQINRWSIDPDGKTMHGRFDDTQGFVQEQTGHKLP